MILEIAVLIGAVLVAGVTFWDEIVEWVKESIESVKKTIEGILYGVKVFVQKVGETYNEISEFYAKQGTEWEKTTVTKKVKESEVPEEIRRKAEKMENKTVDITEELELQLS